MVPRVFSCINTFPLSLNGKIDRKKLPLVDLAATGASNSSGGATPSNVLVSAAPYSDEEQHVQKIFADVLRLSPSSVPINVSFFELGGDSLTALLLLRQLQGYFKERIFMSTLFDQPSVRQVPV